MAPGPLLPLAYIRPAATAIRISLEFLEQNVTSRWLNGGTRWLLALAGENDPAI
jgi:hypothetical protein